MARAAAADPDGESVESQLVPVSQGTKDLQAIMAQEGLLPNLHNAAQYELVFLARLPPVGCDFFTICRCEGTLAAGRRGGGGKPPRGGGFCKSLGWLKSPCWIGLLKAMQASFCKPVLGGERLGSGGRSALNGRLERVGQLALEGVSATPRWPVANALEAPASLALLAGIQRGLPTGCLLA